MKNHKNRIYFHMQAPLSPLMIHSLVKKPISKGPSMYSNCLASKKKNLWFALIQLVLKYADNQRGEEDGWTWLSPWFWKTLTSVQGSSFVWFLILPFSHTAKTRNGVDDADVCFVKVYRKKMRMFDDLIDFSPFCFLIYKRWVVAKTIA